MSLVIGITPVRSQALVNTISALIPSGIVIANYLKSLVIVSISLAAPSD